MKPAPPADFWEQMDRLNDEAAKPAYLKRPPDSFTSHEYARRYNITTKMAQRRLARLRKQGKVTVHGASVNTYWQLVTPK